MTQIKECGTYPYILVCRNCKSLYICATCNKNNLISPENAEDGFWSSIDAQNQNDIIALRTISDSNDVDIFLWIPLNKNSTFFSLALEIKHSNWLDSEGQYFARQLPEESPCEHLQLHQNSECKKVRARDSEKCSRGGTKMQAREIVKAYKSAAPLRQAQNTLWLASPAGVCRSFINAVVQFCQRARRGTTVELSTHVISPLGVDRKTAERRCMQRWFSCGKWGVSNVHVAPTESVWIMVCPTCREICLRTQKAPSVVCLKSRSLKNERGEKWHGFVFIVIQGRFRFMVLSMVSRHEHLKKQRKRLERVL